MNVIAITISDPIYLLYFFLHPSISSTNSFLFRSLQIFFFSFYFLLNLWILILRNIFLFSQINILFPFKILFTRLLLIGWFSFIGLYTITNCLGPFFHNIWGYFYIKSISLRYINRFSFKPRYFFQRFICLF